MESTSNLPATIDYRKIYSALIYKETYVISPPEILGTTTPATSPTTGTTKALLAAHISALAALNCLILVLYQLNIYSQLNRQY
jgi:hypothetical protein